MVGLLAWFVRLMVARLGLLVLSGDRRDAEILALRHQVLVLQRQIKRTHFNRHCCITLAGRIWAHGEISHT